MRLPSTGFCQWTEFAALGTSEPFITAVETQAVACVSLWVPLLVGTESFQSFTVERLTSLCSGSLACAVSQMPAIHRESRRSILQPE